MSTMNLKRKNAVICIITESQCCLAKSSQGKDIYLLSYHVPAKEKIS